jgi:FtsH-binding integral membrane protein
MPKIIKATNANFTKLLSEKRGFLVSVYLLLAIQLGITAIVATYMRRHQEVHDVIARLAILWFIMSLIIIIVLAAVPMPTLLKLALFTIFSVLLGFNCIAASNLVSTETIRIALMATVGVFMAMTALAIGLAAAGIDLSFLSFALFAALLGLLIALIAASFLHASRTIVRVILVFGVVLFSIFIAYDTNVMLQSGNNDVVMSAIQLYLDILNLFTELTGLGSK